MSDSGFTPVGTDGAPLDLSKTVRFVEGMVLGVDDFQQEHAYLAGLANEAARLGAGEGTLYGLKVTALKVTTAGAPDRFEVHVTAGKALDGRGRLISVPEEQCADLGVWITNRQLDEGKDTNLKPKLGEKVNPPNGTAGTLTLFVTLSYARTATDAVPVPGEPCRTDDQMMVPSRWKDDFRLDLALEAPQSSWRREGLRQFLIWSKYALTFDSATPVAADQTAVDKIASDTVTLLRKCRDSARTAGGSPQRLLPAKAADVAGGITAIKINQTDLNTQMACLDAAGVVLVTELLPEWIATPLPAETPDTVLLAGISLSVTRTATTAPWSLDLTKPVTVSVLGRPIALAGPTLRVDPRGD